MKTTTRTEVFAASILATRAGQVVHRTLVLNEIDLAAAKRRAMKRALHDWPPDQGWQGHTVAALPVDRHA